MDTNQNSNSSGMMNGMPQTPQTDKKVGPIVGVLVVVLVLIIAALYFFGTRLNTAPVVQSQPVVQRQNQPVANTANTASVSASDTATLQADLDAQMKDVDYSF